MRNMMRTFFGAIIFSLLLQNPLHGQEPTALDGKFQGLMSRSETYQSFKVIRIESLNDFWLEVTDSLADYHGQLQDLELQVSEITAAAKEQSSTMAQLQAQLKNTERRTQTIDFLGTDFQKNTYHLLVWFIIVALLLTSGWLGWLYRSGFQVTSQAKKELEVVESELNSLRDKSRETQAKLKRELQTALNSLEDLKKGARR